MVGVKKKYSVVLERDFSRTDCLLGWRVGPDCPEFSPEFCFTGVGELDRIVPNLSSRISEYDTPDLKLGGELWDVIAPVRGWEEKRALTVGLDSDEYKPQYFV